MQGQEKMQQRRVNVSFSFTFCLIKGICQYETVFTLTLGLLAPHDNLPPRGLLAGNSGRLTRPQMVQHTQAHTHSHTEPEGQCRYPMAACEIPSTPETTVRPKQVLYTVKKNHKKNIKILLNNSKRP